MPTVVREAGCRFYFYSRENGEPPHIHVEQGDRLAKYWLDPVELAWSKRFKAHELTPLRAMVLHYRDMFLRAWDDHLDAER